MPLRDLTTNTSEMSEQWIEEIVAPYVNYDVENEHVVLLPAAASLPVEIRVLVYLVALRGWPFVTEKAVPTSATPAQIGEALGIRGGTVRPALKELKDSNFISASGRSYSVSVAALPFIKEEISRRTSKGRRSGAATPPARKRSAKKSSTAGKNTRFLYREISEGFFDEPRTLRDVVRRFYESGLIVQKSTISPLLLKAVRTGKLRREKSEINGKRVWVYQSVRWAPA